MSSIRTRCAAVALSTAMAAATMAAVSPAAMAASSSGVRECSTAKGKLRATHTWSPNRWQTFHQVWTTSSAKVKGNVAFPYTYTLWSVTNTAKARVTYANGARVFSTRRGVIPRTTTTWRAKVPFTFNQYKYASCTTR